MREGRLERKGRDIRVEGRGLGKKGRGGGRTRRSWMSSCIAPPSAVFITRLHILPLASCMHSLSASHPASHWKKEILVSKKEGMEEGKKEEEQGEETQSPGRRKGTGACFVVSAKMPSWLWNWNEIAHGRWVHLSEWQQMGEKLKFLTDKEPIRKLGFLAVEVGRQVSEFRPGRRETGCE